MGLNIQKHISFPGTDFSQLAIVAKTFSRRQCCGSVLDPDPNSMYFDPQDCLQVIIVWETGTVSIAWVGCELSPWSGWT